MKKTFRRLSAMIATAIMTIACSAGAINASASGKKAAIKLTEASGVAGQLVTVNLVLDTEESCAGYVANIKFDDRLTLKDVKGCVTSDTDDETGITTVVNFTSSTFKDNKPVSSLTFEIPKDASEGESFDVEFDSVDEFSDYDGNIYENPSLVGTTISVLETAKKVTNYLVFVEEVDGVSVSKTALRGDANLDGKVNIYDSIIIAKSMIKSVKLDAAEAFFADVNQDGKTNIYDAINVSRYGLPSNKSAGWAKII